MAYLSVIGYIYIGELVLKQIWFVDIGKTLFYVVSLQGTHWLSYLVINGFYLFIYKLNHPYFEQYKIEKQSWPWLSNNWNQLLSDTLKNQLYNGLLAVLMISVSCHFVTSRFDLDDFPSHIEIIWQITFFTILEDFLFYVSHRILHTPFLYKNIHKQHHRYNVTISIAAEYAHPIEYIFGNVLPVMAGPTLLGNKVHHATTLLYIGIAIHKTLSDHSGYQFPWDVYQYLPMGTDSDFHSFHHSHNVGNFAATFSYLDTLFGTSLDYYKRKKLEN